jgi:hypothetical protein
MGGVEDIHPEGGLVVFYLGGLACRLEGVGDLEEKLGWFWEVLHAGGRSGGAGAPGVGKFRGESIEKEGL